MTLGNDHARAETIRREAADWLARLHAPDGAADRAAFEQWRMADPLHAATYDRLAMRWDQSAWLAGTALGRDRSLHRATRDSRAAWTRAVAGAVAAMVIVAVGLALFQSGQPSTRAPILISTRVGEIRTVTLDDGSHITLDTGTMLRIRLQRAVRTAWVESGRARFDVAHATDRPFQVIAGGATTVAHGTVFDVALQSPGVTIALLRGSIEVSGAQDSRPAGHRFLAPGQEIVVPAAGPLPMPHAASAGQLKWVGGMLEFDGTTLADAASQFNRYNRIKLRPADPEIGRLRVTGAFRANDAAGFTAAMSSMFGLVATQDRSGTMRLMRGDTRSAKISGG